MQDRTFRLVCAIAAAMFVATADARPPSYLEAAFQDSISVEPFYEWSTDGMGLPPPHTHASAEAGKAHVIATWGGVCGAIHGASVPHGQVNEKLGIRWPIQAYWDTNANNPSGPVICSTTPSPVADGRVNLIHRCPIAYALQSWWEDAAGNPVPNSTPGAKFRVSCTQPLAKAALCPKAGPIDRLLKTLFGNPVSCATRTKIQTESDIPALGAGGLGYTRVYRSDRGTWTGTYGALGSWFGPGTNPLQCVVAEYLDTDGIKRNYCFPLYRGWADSFHYKNAQGVETTW